MNQVQHAPAPAQVSRWRKLLRTQMASAVASVSRMADDHNRGWVPTQLQGEGDTRWADTEWSDTESLATEISAEPR